MKKIIWIVTVIAFTSSIFFLFDSCKKEEESPDCRSTPIESKCELNGYDTVFNYCTVRPNYSFQNVIFYNLIDTEVYGGSWDDENQNISMTFSKYSWMSDYYFPIEPKTYTLEDIGVWIRYPQLETTYIASQEKEGTSLEFTVKSVHHYCENIYGKYFSISGTYSIIAIEDTELNPDTLRITNGVFEKLNKFQNK